MKYILLLLLISGCASVNPIPYRVDVYYEGYSECVKYDSKEYCRPI